MKNIEYAASLVVLTHLYLLTPGYNTVVGERGTRLSRQIQRIGIAEHYIDQVKSQLTK